MLTAFVIKKPVTTLMFFLGLIMMGVISWGFLPQELFPPLVYPQISVFTKYQQASPYEIENLISRPIEETAGTVNRAKKVSSISKEGTSLVMIEFEWGTNMDFASLEVREKLDLIKEKLPKECDEPIVMKYNPFELPMMRINLTGEKDSLKLRNMAKKDIKEELEKIEGVGSIEIVGGLKREIRVEAEESKLRSASLSIMDIDGSLEKANLNYPAGTIKESFFEYLIRTVGEFKNIQEIRELPIKAEYPVPEEKLYYFKEYYKQKEKEDQAYLPEGERLIFVKDIGNVIDGAKERESISRFQGKECVTLLVRKQSQANTVRLSQKIKTGLKEIEKKLPPTLNMKIVYDESNFIKKALGEVKDAGIQGGILTFIVLFFFLRNFWYSFSVAVSIPICILLVLLLLYLSKLGLNIISLGGLALGVGMLVDNNIVVLESIFVNSSSNIKDRTITGTNEVNGAILGSTFTTVCVFLPMIFVVGIAGQIFKQLSFSIVFSLLASYLVAITIQPLAVYFHLKKKALKPTEEKDFKLRGWENLFTGFFEHRVLTLCVVAGLFALSAVIFINLPKELFPKYEQHEFIVKLDNPPGAPLEKTDRITKDIENLLFNTPQVKEVTSNIGSSQEGSDEKTVQSQGQHQAQIFVKLDEKSSTSAVINDLRDKFDFIKENGTSISLIAQESFLKEAFVQEAPLILQIKGDNLDDLKKIGKELEEGLKTYPFLYNVKLDYPPPRPEVVVSVVKDKAFIYNISTHLIAATVNTSLKGRVSTKFKEKGEEYDIKVILRKEDRQSVDKLKRLLVHGIYQDKETTIPLMDIAEVKEGLGPLEIKRKEGERTMMLTASIYKMPLNKVISNVQNSIKKITLPPGYRVEISGEAENMKESTTSLKYALIFAVVLVFMIMAGQFESLWQPFIILFTLPLSLIGVSLILLLTGSALNIISFLGLIMLGGIVVNNGIVLVDYINLLRRERNMCLEEAIKLASVRRMRPILMTSLTTILGVLPLCIMGKGTSLMQPLGLVTMGGLASATLFTPVVIPILYYYFDTFLAKIKERFSKPAENSGVEINPLEKETAENSTGEIISPSVSKVQGEGVDTENIIEKAEEIVEEKFEEENTAEQVKTEVKPQTPELHHRQMELIEYLKKNGKITRADYARLFKISIPTAARDLKALLSLGLIKSAGPLGPGRFYLLK